MRPFQSVTQRAHGLGSTARLKVPLAVARRNIHNRPHQTSSVITRKDSARHESEDQTMGKEEPVSRTDTVKQPATHTLQAKLEAQGRRPGPLEQMLKKIAPKEEAKTDPEGKGTPGSKGVADSRPREDLWHDRPLWHQQAVDDETAAKVKDMKAKAKERERYWKNQSAQMALTVTKARRKAGKRQRLLIKEIKKMMQKMDG